MKLLEYFYFLFSIEVKVFSSTSKKVAELFTLDGHQEFVFLTDRQRSEGLRPARRSSILQPTTRRSPVSARPSRTRQRHQVLGRSTLHHRPSNATVVSN